MRLTRLVTMPDHTDITLELALIEALLGGGNYFRRTVPSSPIVFVHYPGGTHSMIYIAHGHLGQRSQWEVFDADSPKAPLAVHMIPRIGRGWLLNSSGEWRWPPTDFPTLLRQISDPAWRKRAGLPELPDG